MTTATTFLGVDGKLDATLIADHVAIAPTPLGRGVDGDLYEYRDGVFVRDEHIVTKRVAAALGAKYSRTVEGQAEAHLMNKDLPEVGLPDIPSGRLPYIVLENGIYWWAENALDAHTPDLGALTKLPIVYDPIAIPHSFMEWLGQVFGDDADMQRHVWEVIGYLMMTGNPFQKIILFHGPGGDGKGTLMRVLRAMLGKQNYSSVSLHQLVDDRFATSSLYGKIANISGDISDQYLASPQVLKEITGGDSINASRKFGQSFEFVPYAVPLFSSNNHFRTSDSSRGWRRRWMVIDFPTPVEEMALTGQLPYLDEQNLISEVPAIFNCGMDGLRRLMQRGKFAPPAAADEATTRMHNEADPFMLWLDEDEHVFLAPDDVTPCADVYRKYTGWCRRNGYSALASGPFGMRLKGIGIAKTRPRTGTGRTWHYAGIGVMLGTTDA